MNGNGHIRPIPNSPQERFLKSSVREVGYGGAAGGAKSYGLILDALYQIGKDDYNALLLRRTYKQLSGADGLIALSRKVYPHVGGHYIKSEHLWEFDDYPGTIRFGHIEHDNDLEQNYEGHQYAYLGFDELQTFTERMYLYLFSRNRSSNPEVTPFTRSTFMPGGIGHFWVKKRFIDSGITNRKRHFRRIDGMDRQVRPRDPMGMARMFIPARLEDNPYLYQDGRGSYEQGLHQLESVDFKRRRWGDWDIRRTGRVYHQFLEPGPASYELDLRKAEGFYHAHDFGAVNRAWGLFVKIGNAYYLMHEEMLPEGTTQTRAGRIKAHFKNRKMVAGWGGAKSEDQQRKDYGQAGVVVRLPRVTDVESQIDMANQMFEDGELVICSDMTLTVDQLENCVRDEKEGIADKSVWHHLDVLRYFAGGAGKLPKAKVTMVEW
jgi:hypothetical protein